MKFTKNQIRVSLFLLVPVAIIFIFILLKLGYSLAGSTVDVYLKVENISSIKKGTQVKVKGYQIGKITEITPVYKPALHFLAVMRINREIEIFEDCSAIIQNQNIIGEPEIEIRNPEKKGELISENTVIEGVEYVNLESLLQEVNNLLVNVSSTVDVFKGMSTDSKNNIKMMLTNLAGSTASLNRILMDSQSDISAIFESIQKTLKTVDNVAKEFEKRPISFSLFGTKEKAEKKND
jgi:ABC-type transporter Mla subunit MlaD